MTMRSAIDRLMNGRMVTLSSPVGGTVTTNASGCSFAEQSFWKNFRPRLSLKRQSAPSGSTVSALAEEPVTIAACLKFDDGVLFCADTKITTDVKTNQTKIFANAYGGDSYCATVFVVAGSVPYAKAAVIECENRIA